jgi:DNA-binding MarR family transcriptional regulator
MSRQKVAEKRRSGPRQQLLESVGLEIRRMGAQSVITSQTIADRFGLHTTDLECLDLIYMRGQASAGELAKATALTSGAVTALIDRLARAGYVERLADPDDRRRVQVRIRTEAIEPIKAVYQPMQAQMFKLWSHYSKHDLEVIVHFLSHSTDLAIACAEELRSEAVSQKTKRRRARTSVSD